MAPTNVKKHFGLSKFSSVKITGRGFHYMENSVNGKTQIPTTRTGTLSCANQTVEGTCKEKVSRREVLKCGIRWQLLFVPKVYMSS